jgi:hypothetical protein
LNGLSERVRIESTGRVGIGTTSPVAKLHVDDKAVIGTTNGAFTNNWALTVATAESNAAGTGHVSYHSGSTGLNYHVERVDTSHTFVHDVFNGTWQPAVAIKANGNVGIGTTSPAAPLDVAGSMYSRSYDATAATAIDWSQANVQTTSTNTAALTFTNMQDGGSYTLACTGTTSVTHTFSQSSLTFKFVPANGPTTASSTTVYTFLRIGGVVYVSWITGF